MNSGKAPTICLLAGDVSGDQNAARLARAILRSEPRARLIGAGGSEMEAAGVDVRVHTTDLSFVGLLSSLRFLGPLLSRYRKVRRLFEEIRPDVVVLIDSESVSMPLFRWLHRRGVPTVFFFPPQVWFWGRWRLRGIAARKPRVLSTFREETELFRSAGVDARWVGHPLRDAVSVPANGARELARTGLDPDRPVVALMPGSRRSEIERLTPAIFGAARELQTRNPGIQLAIPLATEALRGLVAERVSASGLRDTVVYRPDSYAVLASARVAIQSSGTATLETALLGIPSVIVYRCIPFEYFVGRFLIRVPFIGMVNILLGEMVQPEFFNKNVDAEHLANEAWSLLTDEVRRASIQTRLARLPEILGPHGAIDRCAGAILELLPGASANRALRGSAATS